MTKCNYSMAFNCTDPTSKITERVEISDKTVKGECGSKRVEQDARTWIASTSWGLHRKEVKFKEVCKAVGPFQKDMTEIA